MTLTSGSRRRLRITIRLSPEERHTLDAAAENSALTLSEYVRCILTRSRPLPAARRPSVEASLLARVLAQLGKIGCSLTRIAEAAAQGTSGIALMPFLERELLHALTELKTCRVRLLESLGRKATAS